MDDITLIKSFIDPHYCYLAYEYIVANIEWASTRKNSSGRKMAYVSDDGRPYIYAGRELAGTTWNVWLYEIKGAIQRLLMIEFNSVLLNAYENGKDEIRWHSDKEPQLGPNPIIPCFNLGDSRNFWFMEKKTGTKTPYLVENGNLLIMGPNCQKHYLHAILKEKDVKETRISLTYRKVYDNLGEFAEQTNTQV